MDFFYSTSDNMIGGGYSDVLKSVALSKLTEKSEGSVRTYLWVIIILIILSCVSALLMGDVGKMFSSFNTNLLISANCLAIIGIGMALAYMCSCETISKVDTLTSLAPAINPSLNQISPILSQTLSPTMQSVIPTMQSVQSAIPSTQQILPTGSVLPTGSQITTFR